VQPVQIHATNNEATDWGPKKLPKLGKYCGRLNKIELPWAFDVAPDILYITGHWI